MHNTPVQFPHLSPHPRIPKRPLYNASWSLDQQSIAGDAVHHQGVNSEFDRLNYWDFFDFLHFLAPRRILVRTYGLYSGPAMGSQPINQP
jgi:hypothetical protein